MSCQNHADIDLVVNSGNLYVSTYIMTSTTTVATLCKSSGTRILESGTVHFGHGLKKEFPAQSRRRV